MLASAAPQGFRITREVVRSDLCRDSNSVIDIEHWYTINKSLYSLRARRCREGWDRCVEAVEDGEQVGVDFKRGETGFSREVAVGMMSTLSTAGTRHTSLLMFSTTHGSDLQ